MNLWQSALPPLAVLALALPAGSSIASTCKDELNSFQSRLYGSQIPATDPQLFGKLMHKAKLAATFRDERRCLEQVAELREVLLEEDAVREPVRRAASGQEVSNDPETTAPTRPAPARPAPARPAPPTMMVEEREESASGDEEPATDDEAADEDGHDAERVTARTRLRDPANR